MMLGIIYILIILLLQLKNIFFFKFNIIRIFYILNVKKKLQENRPIKRSPPTYMLPTWKDRQFLGNSSLMPHLQESNSNKNTEN